MKKLLLLLLIVSNYTFGQFSESFEGTGTPTGWTIINGGSPNTWVSADLGSSSTIQAQNGTKVFTIQYNTAAHNDFLVTPQFLVAAGTTSKLTFWARSRDVNYPETIAVKASTTTATAAAMTTVLVASVAPAGGTNFVKYTVDLSTLVGQSIYIGFQSTSQDQFIFDIDNVVVGGTPTCNESLTTPTLTSITTTSAVLNWTAASPAPSLGYEVVLSTSGVAPTATTAATATVPSATTLAFTGLTPSTKYYAYVRSVCSASSTSVWGHLAAFLTATPPIVPPYSYGFDNQAGGFVADGWSGTGTTASTWSTNFAAGNPHLGAGLIFSNNATAAAPNPVNRWMFSPAFQLQANSVNTITFYVRCLGASPVPAQNFKVTVGASPTIAAQTTVVYTNTALANTAWTQITATYTPTVSGVYHFAFNHISATQQTSAMSLALDTFAISSVLGNDQFKVDKLAVYPNPTSSILNISTNNSDNISAIQIVDLNGRQVYTKSFNNVADAQVDVNELSTGMYLINISTGDKTVTKKFMKQ